MSDEAESRLGKLCYQSTTGKLCYCRPGGAGPGRLTYKQPIANVYISWASDSRDLDICAYWVGMPDKQVGWSYTNYVENEHYSLRWYGDNTSYGGSEKLLPKLLPSWDSAISNRTLRIHANYYGSSPTGVYSVKVTSADGSDELVINNVRAGTRGGKALTTDPYVDIYFDTNGRASLAPSLSQPVRLMSARPTSRETPLTFTFAEDGVVTTLRNVYAVGDLDLQYSIDDGKTWDAWTPNDDGHWTHTAGKAGSTLMLKGDNKALGQSAAAFRNFSFSRETAASGNLLSLVGYREELPDYCFFGLFSGCTTLTTAPDLPATVLGKYCCASLFQGCTNLKTAPELPAIEGAYKCYQYLFYGCTALERVKVGFSSFDAFRTGTTQWLRNAGTSVAKPQFHWRGGSLLTRTDDTVPERWSILPRM